jgi:hypothetical protein
MASPALYWKTQPTGTVGIGFTGLLSGAQQVMQAAGLTGITVSSVDVSGRTPNCHAAMTFLGTGTGYTALIIAAGSEAKAVLGKLSTGFDQLTWL